MRSYATGAVNGTDDDVGGLVGKNTATGNITQSYANVTVSTPNYNVGGLVGMNEGAITQAYATGAVSGLLREVLPASISAPSPRLTRPGR